MFFLKKGRGLKMRKLLIVLQKHQLLIKIMVLVAVAIAIAIAGGAPDIIDI
jgi:hypothetical protein